MALVSVPNSNVSMYNHLRHLKNPSAGGSNISFNTIRTNVHGATYLFSYYRNSSFRRVQVFNTWTVEGGTMPMTAPTVSTTSPTTQTSSPMPGTSVYMKGHKAGAYNATIRVNITYDNNVQQYFDGWYGNSSLSSLLATSEQYTIGSSSFTSQYSWYSSVTIDDFCTPAGTKISMASGSDKNVEDVVVGDVLKSANLPGVPDTDLTNWDPKPLYEWDSGVTSPEEWTDWSLTEATVISVDSKDVPKVLSVNGGQLKMTPGHILVMYTQRMDGSRGWCMRKARCLHVGDYILQQNGTGILVSSIDEEGSEENPITVYKVNVENDDFYWTNGFMSHNAK